MILITSPNLSQLKIFHPAVAAHIRIMPSPAYSLSYGGFLRCQRLNDLRRRDLASGVVSTAFCFRWHAEVIRLWSPSNWTGKN